VIGWPSSEGTIAPAYDYCVEDDGFLDQIIRESCSLFHREHRWPGYPRTLQADIDLARDLAARIDVTRAKTKVRSFFLPCSDPARIAWEGSSEPVIAANLDDRDIAGLGERQLLNQPAFLSVFFGAFLTRAGDFDQAERFYSGMVEQGLAAEGWFGLADIQHLLARWAAEHAEYEALGVFPRHIEIPLGYEHDRIPTLQRYGFAAAIADYERAVAYSPDVSFYRLHLARALIDAGELRRARESLARAAQAPSANPFVAIYLNFADQLLDPGVDKRSGDFLPTAFLRQQYQQLIAARVTDVDGLARKTGLEPIALGEHQRLTGAYVAITNGAPVTRALALDYPAPKALPLPVMRDLSLGLTLALESQLIAEGPALGLQHLKLFVRPVLMIGEGRALIGLPANDRVARGDKLLVPLPAAPFNYYHWVMDAMGAAAMLDRTVGADQVEFVTTHALDGWRKEVLDRVLPGAVVHVLPGAPEDRIILNGLYLPRPARLNLPHPQAVRLLRERMSRHGKARPGKRVVVRRPQDRGRRTVNEAAIHDYLAGRGFEVFDPAGKSVADQIAYFADVEVFVSPGGAALTNLLFCPAETKVVVLASAFHHHETFTALAAAIGQPCWVCLGGCETRPNPHLIWSVFDHDARLEDVAIAVDQALSA